MIGTRPFRSCFALILAGCWPSSAIRAQVLYKAVDLAPFFKDGSANALNDSGQIAGEISFQNSSSRAVFFDGVSTWQLGTLGGENARPLAINAKGELAGLSTKQDGQTVRAFICVNQKMMELPASGDGPDIPHDINNADQIVGRSNGLHAALWQNGTLTLLPTLGGSFSEAFAINDAGAIVGHSYVEDFTPAHAFLY